MVTGREDDANRRVLFAVSHGTDSPAGQVAIKRLVEAVRVTDPRIVVRAGFVDVQKPTVSHLIGALGGAEDAVIVPLLLTAGFHVRVDLADSIRLVRPGRIVLADALGPDQRLASVLVRRLREIGVTAEDRVVLAAAGSSDDRAVADCRVMAEMLAAELGMPVTIGFLSAASPSLPAALQSARELSQGVGRVLVSTFLLAPGYFFDRVRSSGADLVTPPLLEEFGDVAGELVAVVLDRYRSSLPA